MSNLDQLIHYAYEGFSQTAGIPELPQEAFETVRRALTMEVGDFMDHFARRVAHQYFASNLSYEVADCALNSLSMYCLSHYDVNLPSYADDVYHAFDQGEYVHANDEAGTDPEIKYTKPAIFALVTRDRILGYGLGRA